MTAQNMGKKILTEAGYDVVAVSNGAAAVKKIAEQKPDIIILDVYMPGYTGLEVCEKVRSSIHTIKTPVLLTVGKMEAYRPEDASRVRADGVIVKPFEASDLLAVIKKLEQKIEKPREVEQTVLLERPKFEEPEELKADTGHHDPIGVSRMQQPSIDVPDEMASTSAFSDLLGSAPEVQPAPAAAAEVPVEPVPAAAAPQFDVPVSWGGEASEAAPAPESVAVPAGISDPSTPPATFQEVPIQAEPAIESSQPEVVPTLAPSVEVAVTPEPSLETNAADETRSTVAERTEPSLEPTLQAATIDIPAGGTPELVTDSTDLSAFTTRFGVSHPDDVPVGLVSDLPPAALGPDVEFENKLAEPVRNEGAPLRPPMSDDDFEARVAAAMAAYDQPITESVPAAPAARSITAVEYVAEVEAEPAPVAEAEPPITEAIPAVSEPPRTEVAPPVTEIMPPVTEAMPRMEEVSPAPAAGELEPVRSFDYIPGMGAPSPYSEPDPPVTEMLAAIQAPAPAAEPERAILHSVDSEHVQQAVEAAATPVVEQAAAAAAGESGTDHHTISQVIHRVMERLKPELVEEIMRELKSKK